MPADLVIRNIVGRALEMISVSVKEAPRLFPLFQLLPAGEASGLKGGT